MPPPPSESASESEYAASSSPPPGTGAGSNPFLVDSDGDGYTDREEYTAGTSNANPGSNPGTYAPPSGVLNPDTSYVNGLQLQYRAKWMWSRWTGTGGSFNPTPPIYNFLSEGGAYHHANLETTSPALYPRTQALYDLYPYISPAYEGASFLAAPVTMFATNAELWAGQNYRQERTELGYGNVYYYRRENVRRVFEITSVASGGAAADAQRFCAVRLQSYNYSTAQWGVVDTGLVSFQRNFAFCSPNVATYCKASGARILTEPPLLYSSPPDIDASPSVVDRRQTIMTSLVPLDIRIVPDYDRDGDIDDNDKNQVSTHNPWRWWINDDDDWGDTAANDTPGQDTYADFRGFTIDGLTDLPDFFPVQLQIKALVDLFPPSSFEYRLFHPNAALSFVETSLDGGNCRQFLTHGPTAENINITAATRSMVSEGPNLLSTGFLAALQQNTSKGILLVQGKAATEVPFHLQVSQNNKVYATISFPVKISPVEQFYRWINLRGVPDLDPGRNGAPIGTVARATAVGMPPNRPDSLTSNKHFVFMHGYNVDEDSARGWGSEVFKRMYQLGMKAKFTMVTWRGNKSQVGGVTPDYWQNVTNAFITAPHLKTALDSLPGTKVLTAHSLGNMVACSAIKDHGLAVEQYFMLDAAVPLEAIDESADSRATMRHPEWAEYDQTLNGTDLRQYWASDWYKQFLFTNDARKTLTWKGRFGDIPNATNYYSSGEEVLQNSDGTFPGPGGLRAWVQQELSKGRPDSVMGMAPYNDPQGGWGHNAYWFMPGPNPQKRTPQELLDVPLSATAENPFFMRFRFSYLHDNTLGSATAADYWVRNKTLGAGIPAISNPVGSNPIQAFIRGTQNRNFDLMTFRDSWPLATGTRAPFPDRWLHSDAKDVALRFNHPLYTNWLTRGNLQ